ncbi:MAG: hypothetical protein NTV22_04720 [bacterium]|nr:hypothetical protein [bacterium]
MNPKTIGNLSNVIRYCAQVIGIQNEDMCNDQELLDAIKDTSAKTYALVEAFLLSYQKFNEYDEKMDCKADYILNDPDEIILLDSLINRKQAAECLAQHLQNYRKDI